MPELYLHNHLTRGKERFEPVDPLNVRMYVCGPTVYDLVHVGNGRAVVKHTFSDFVLFSVQSNQTIGKPAQP